ncbi:MAG: LemA family protein [Nanoarchaeota archaeon]|nr:LemA family protein [Nanoarchaeota archaeon]
MQDYERKSVSEVTEEINKTYFLPDIQRSFVWKPEQVYALFDSIMRDYPISTFLFWKQRGEYIQEADIKKLEFVKTSKDKNKENTEIHSAKEYLLVLDGQQRLTTFYLVLKGNYIIRNSPYELYFNILSGNEEEEDGILYEFKFYNRNRGMHFFEKDGDIDKLWYGVKGIYDLSIAKIFSEVTNINKNIKAKYNIELTDDQRNSIAKLCQYLKTEKIIYYYPELEKNYDKVLDIFVRTNSGGTPLSYSDLLFSTIKSKWNEARDKFDGLLNNINENDRYRFTNDFILKTALLLYATNTEGVRYKTKNFKSDLINKIQTDWKSIEQAVELSTDVLKDKLFLTSHKTIYSNNAIIPIIYWVFKNKLKGFGIETNCIDDGEISKIKTWLIKALLSGVFGGQSDTILYKCKEAVDNNLAKPFPGEEMEKRINTETKKSTKLDSDILDKVFYNSADSYLVLSICYGGTVNFSPRFKGNLPEQDHIFCQDELRTAKIPEEKINSIFNIRYIGSTENKTKSNTPFSQWMQSFSSEAEKKEELKKHLIPNLVETVQGYARHEKSVLTAVTEARSMATAVKIDPKDLENPEKFQQYVEAQKKLDGALSRLLVVVEQYPQLKANEGFLKLQDQLEGAENRISVERKRYNEAATEYNKAIRKFPGNIFTGIWDFKPLALFKADEKAKEVPKVKFD